MFLSAHSYIMDKRTGDILRQRIFICRGNKECAWEDMENASKRSPFDYGKKFKPKAGEEKKIDRIQYGDGG